MPDTTRKPLQHLALAALALTSLAACSTPPAPEQARSISGQDTIWGIRPYLSTPSR